VTTVHLNPEKGISEAVSKEKKPELKKAA
jgi:hypothetical protein